MSIFALQKDSKLSFDEKNMEFLFKQLYFLEKDSHDSLKSAPLPLVSLDPNQTKSVGVESLE